jgi:hypothetical protein
VTVNPACSACRGSTGCAPRYNVCYIHQHRDPVSW